jgi:hypothetical protein
VAEFVALAVAVVWAGAVLFSVAGTGDVVGVSFPRVITRALFDQDEEGGRLGVIY